MTYAILNASTITAHGTPRQLWPDVSFPRSGPNAAFLAEQDAVEIRHDLPHDSETHYLQAVPPYLLDGVVFDRVAEVRPPVPPQPRWQEFRAALRAIPEIQTLIATLAQADPMGHLAIGVGLGQAAQGDSTTFLGVWAELLASGLVPAAMAAQVQALAGGFDLPAEFLAGLNPATIEP